MVREYKVDQIGEVVGGGTPSTANAEYWNGDIPWISPKDLTGYSSVYISCGESSITKEGLNKSGTRLLPKDTVLFSSRAPIGYVAIAQNPLCTNQGFKSIICNKSIIDPLYLYYYIKANLDYFKLWGSGATFPEISGSAMRRIKVSIIDDIGLQKKISTLLYSYDNLIEVNNKRIKILEQMAENLYKEWFVRFRFPGHETAEFENGLPKGWKRNRISHYYLTSSGGTPSRDHDEYYDGGTIPWIKTGELQDCLLIDTEEKITEAAVKRSSAKIFPKDSVLMAMYGVNIGMQAYSTMKATCNQACCVFRDKGSINTKHYLFQCLKSIRDYLFLIGFGAAQQNLSQDLIKRIRIVMPDKDTLIKLEQKIEPLYRETKLLLKANAKLIQQRDLLLPRLMSGKLEV